MNELFKLVLKLSISGSIFFILFFIVSFITKKVFSAKWHLLILKVNMIFYFIPMVLFYDLFIKGSKNVNTNTFNTVFNEIENYNYPIKVTEYLVTIWVVGIIVISFWNFYCYKRFAKTIKASVYSDEELKSAVNSCRLNLNIAFKIKVRRSAIVTSPMIIGIGDAMIVFPSNIKYSSKLKPVITHELIHYKRKDLWFKLMQLVIMTMNWFNPIVYIMNNTFEKWCEISCDEIVAENMSYSERKEYGQTILSIIENLSISHNNLWFYLCSDKNYIKRRLIMMLNIKKPSKIKKFFGGVLVCTVVLFSIGSSVTLTTNNSSVVAINSGNTIIEANDDGIKELLQEKVEELKNENRLNSDIRGAITIVDVETGEVLGSSKFSSY